MHAALGADTSDVRFVFASVDPARDTPAKADAYAKRFHPSFIGLSGSRAQVDATAAAWGVVLGPGGAPTHTAQVFMVGPDGRLSRGYGQSATVEQIVALIRSFDARAAGAPAAHAVTSLEWAPLGRGVDYATATVDAPGPGDADFRIVRIDPSVARIQPALAAKEESSRLTAGAWCEAKRFVATINLGMFQDDGLSNVGYCRVGERVFSGRWVASYKSLFVAGARKPDIAAATLLDLDRPGARERAEDYEVAIQNLRLIRSPGVGVWERQPKRWSEAAVAEGDGGRLYFIFLRRALAMKDFNDAVLALPLGIRTAMHVEGGPEASLSIRGVSASRDFSGSFETGFHESDDVSVQWPIPNVLGVAADAGD